MILRIHINGQKLNNINFIAEIASTHDGSTKELIRLIKKIELNSDDYLKFQIFQNKDLCHKTSKLYSGLKKIEIPLNFWKKLINEYKKKINLILEPFDEKSYIFSKKFKNDVLIKISSSEHDNVWMIKDAIKNFKKVFINISGYELKSIIGLLKKIKVSKKKVILMYGFQSFPSNPEDLRLSIIKKIIKSGYKAGYADHSDTSKVIGSYLSTAQALEMGATYVEKHVTIDRNKKKPDYISSFNPYELHQYISFFKDEFIRFLEKRSAISNKEKKYCNVMGKHAVIDKNLKKNEIIKFEHIKFLRTGKKGINREQVKSLIKKKSITKRKIKKDMIIKMSDFL